MEPMNGNLLKSGFRNFLDVPGNEFSMLLRGGGSEKTLDKTGRTSQSALRVTQDSSKQRRTDCMHTT